MVLSININKRLIGNLVDIVQYSIICYIFAIVVARFINKYIFKRSKTNIHDMSFIRLNINMLGELIFLTIVFYYITILIELIPSISSILIPGFVSSDTIEYTIHIAFLYLFLEIFPTLRYKIELLGEKYLYHHK